MTNEQMVNVAEMAMGNVKFFGIQTLEELEELRDFAEAVLCGVECAVEEKKIEERGISRSINLVDEIEKVTFNNPATIVFWKDGTKTVSKCCKGDTYNKETGLAMCIVRKLCNNRHYNDVFEKFCK